MAKKEEKTRENKLRDICSAINKGAFGGENHDAVTWLGSREAMALERFSSGCYELDEALGGGWPKGRFIEIFGPESGGKTTLVLHAIAEHQRKYPDEDVGLVDAEFSFDEDYAVKLGVNTKYLIVNQPSSGSQALNVTRQMIQNGIKAVVFDSVAALTTDAELAGDLGDVKVAEQTRMMSSALRTLTAEAGARKVTIFFTNQIREKIGVLWGDKTTTPAGRALKHYASIRVMIKRIGMVKEKIDGEDVIVSARTQADVKKNKCIASGEVLFVPDEGRCYFVDEMEGRLGFGISSYDGIKMVNTVAKSCKKQSVESCLDVGVRGVGSLIVNEQHPFLTPDGYVEAKDLMKRDLVAAVGKIDMPFKSDVDSRWTENMSILTGMLLGDGWTGGTTGVALRNFNPQCVSKMKQACDEMGCEIYEKEDQKGLWVIRHKGGGWKGKPNYVYDIIRSGEIWGKRAYDKIIPPELFFCSSRRKGDFIGGLIATDGCVVGEGKDRWCVSITTVSKKLAEGFRHILLSEGIMSCISSRKPSKGGVVDGRQIIGKRMRYDVRIRKTSSVYHLCALVGWSGGKMDKITINNTHNDIEPIIWKRVKYIRPVGERMTYDICESGYENFEIHGLITHNTAVPFRKAEFCISFGHGIDRIAEILDSAVTLGLVQKRGSFLFFNDEQLGQGRAVVLEMMRNDEELTKKISEALKKARESGVKAIPDEKVKGIKRPSFSKRGASKGEDGGVEDEEGKTIEGEATDGEASVVDV